MNGEASCQVGGYAVPHGVGLRIAMQQQESRAMPADSHPDRATRRGHVEEAEAGEERVRRIEFCDGWVHGSSFFPLCDVLAV